jgi:hypothetical protein
MQRLHLWFRPQIRKQNAGVAQLVERNLAKVEVESSSLFSRSNISSNRPCGSVAEHSLGKGEVAGPIPAMGTNIPDKD